MVAYRANQDKRPRLDEAVETTDKDRRQVIGLCGIKEMKTKIPNVKFRKSSANPKRFCAPENGA